MTRLFPLLLFLIFSSNPASSDICFNVTCSKSETPGQLLEIGGDPCINCSECFQQQYSLCTRITEPSESSVQSCICGFYLPEDCKVQEPLAEDEELVYRVCSQKEVDVRKQLPKYTITGNDSDLWITIPLQNDRYWRSILLHENNFEILKFYFLHNNCDSASSCRSGVDHVTFDQNFHEITASIPRTSIPTGDEIGFEFALNFTFHLLEFIREEVHKISTPAFAVSDKQLIPQRFLNGIAIVKGQPSGHSNLTALLLILFLVAIALLIALVLFLRRRRLWPFARSRAKDVFSYEYNLQNQRISLSKPIGIGSENETALLDEFCPEIQEFRELWSKTPMVLPPKLDIKETIGHGKFGLIRKGVLLNTQQDTMVHLTKSPYRQNVDELKGFLKDLEGSVKAGDHPNILGLLGVCDQDERMLICVELVGGPNLQTLLRESRTQEHFVEYAQVHQIATLMSAKRLLNLMLGVTRAVCHLEQCQVIHTHLAAVNILIGEGGTPKLTGFGFSNVADLYARDQEKRHSPVRWWAPESIPNEAGEGLATCQSQIWSFGVVLWEILTLGGTPYHDLETSQVKDLVKKGECFPSKPAYCDDQLYDLMRRCWRYEPLDRIRGMGALKDLQDFALNSEEHIDLNMKDGQFQYIPIKSALEEEA